MNPITSRAVTFASLVSALQIVVTGTVAPAADVHPATVAGDDTGPRGERIGRDPARLTRGPYLQQGTPTSVVIRWRTDMPTTSRVTIGTTAGELTRTIDGVSPTTEHQVYVSGLVPNTRYFYSVGTPTMVLAAGADHSFRTAPVRGAIQPTRVWVLGDSGTADANAAAVRNAYAAFTAGTDTDVWLMLGDNAYDTGTDAEYQAAVFNMYPTFLRQAVLWPTIGNHDTAQNANPPLTLPYFQVFTLPTAGEAGGVASGTEKYYSFDFANVHFICLDSMTSTRAPHSPMVTWLENDLASTVQEWIIAYWHHPPYTKGSHNSDTETPLVEMRQHLLPTLEAGGVDLVLTGHSHSYERSFLLNGHYGPSSTFTPAMKVDPGSGRPDEGGAYAKPGHNAAMQGAVYITAGSSGRISGGSLNHPAMFVSLNTLGSMVLDVDGSELHARFLRENGMIADHFTISKRVIGSPSTPPPAPERPTGSAGPIPIPSR